MCSKLKKDFFTCRLIFPKALQFPLRDLRDFVEEVPAKPVVEVEGSFKLYLTLDTSHLTLFH